MLSAHFSEAEFACKDCGHCMVSPALVDALEEYRKIVKLPVTVLSGCRCVEHNQTVGGKSDSQHLFSEGDIPRFCTAADIRVPGLSLQEMYDAALRIPAFFYGGIGVYDGGFVHLDTRDKQARWARKAGKYTSIALSGLVEERS